MEYVNQDIIKEQLTKILSYGEMSPDDPLRTKVEWMIEEVYGKAPQEEYDAIVEVYQGAFGLDATRVDMSGEGTPEATRETPGNRSNVVPATTAVGAAKELSDKFELLVPDGFFRSYLDWTQEHESPSQYHFGSALAGIAAGLGRAPIIEWEARDLYPNLFVLLVGPTGARKGAAIDRGTRLVARSMGANLLPNEGTHQGFAAALRRRMVETNGELADGLIIAPEFSVLLSKDQNKADLVKWLTDWYDSPPMWERALRGEEDGYELRNVTVSVLGGSNIEWLRTMPGDAITGGFMPRFIIFHTPDKRFWKARPKFDKDLEIDLLKHLAEVSESVPESIAFGGDAGEYLDYWYEEDLRAAYELHPDEQYRAWLARKQAAAMKLAVVWQLADLGPTDQVRLKWMEQARAVVDWGDQAVSEVYGALGVSAEGLVAEDVRRTILLSGGLATRKSIVAALRAKYMTSKIDSALATLRAAGLLVVERRTDKGQVYRLV